MLHQIVIAGSLAGLAAFFGTLAYVWSADALADRTKREDRLSDDQADIDASADGE